MAKRFIDTGIFDDAWFMDLSKDGKILWLYFITKCDHAGMLTMNIKLCKVQTGISDIQTVIKELGNRIVTVGELLFFVPKFVQYQYPGFPDCNFKAAQSAIQILSKYNLIKEGKLTVAKELDNSYGIGNGISNGNGKNEEEVLKKINIEFEVFWNLYDKKVGDKDKLIKKWLALSDLDRAAAIKYIPGYIASKPDKQFRKDPTTFLNNKSWNDEIIPAKSDKKKSFGLNVAEMDYSPDQKF